MTESTELKVLPDDIVPTNYTKMKGSLLRIGHSRLIRPNLSQTPSHHIHTSLQLTPPASSPPKDPLHGSPNYPGSPSQLQDLKFPKTMSIMVHKEALNVRTKQRACTPSAAKNYMRNQRITEYQSAELQQVPPGRYFTGQAGNEAQSRMSLAGFQDNVRGVKLVKKVSKTEEELVGLKLEGTQCKMTLGSARSRGKEKGRSVGRQSCQFVQDWYITQQATKVSLGHPSHDNFNKIIQRIQQQKDRIPSVPSHTLEQKIQSCKKLRLRTPSGSRTHQRNLSARLREQAHLNIINIQQRPGFFQEQPPKHPYHELYARYLRSLKESHQEKPPETLDSKHPLKDKDIFENFSEFEKELHDIRRIPEGLLGEKKGDTIRMPKKQQKAVLSRQEQKLQQRKNLMKNYTFKKQKPNLKGQGKSAAEQGQGHNQDFHVEGWNYSQEFQRKEVVLMV